ncbi:MAG: hypothetical protein ACREBB_08535 [Nitrosotalea sp.]
MRNAKLLAFIALVFLAGSIFASHASAQQYQPQSGTSNVQRTPVNGTYTNSDFGVQITLPDGWSGFEMKRTSGATSVIAAPGGFQSMQGHRPSITMMISMTPKSVMATPRLMSQRMAQNDTCSNISTGNNSANGVSLTEVVVNCTGPTTMEAKYEVAQTNSSYVIVSYRANSTSNYESQVATFDSAVSTLQIANAMSAPAIPEFPVPAIGIIVAIMVGVVVIMGRTKIMQTHL